MKRIELRRKFTRPSECNQDESLAIIDDGPSLFRPLPGPRSNHVPGYEGINFNTLPRQKRDEFMFRAFMGYLNNLAAILRAGILNGRFVTVVGVQTHRNYVTHIVTMCHIRCFYFHKSQICIGTLNKWYWYVLVIIYYYYCANCVSSSRRITA